MLKGTPRRKQLSSPQTLHYSYFSERIHLSFSQPTLYLLFAVRSVHTGSNIHSDPSICLVCGVVACFACYSCRRFEALPESTVNSESGTTSTVPRQEAVVYEIQAHMRSCHAGYGMAMLFTGGVLLFTDQARRTIELTSPYRDEFGEPDIGLR